MPGAVMRLGPRQHAGDWQSPAHGGGLRPTRGKVAGPVADRLAAPGTHAEGGAAVDGQAGKCSNGTRPRPPPDVPELRMQNRRARGIQFTAHAHHGHVVVIMG